MEEEEEEEGGEAGMQAGYTMNVCHLILLLNQKTDWNETRLYILTLEPTQTAQLPRISANMVDMRTLWTCGVGRSQHSYKQGLSCSWIYRHISTHKLK